MIAKYWAQVFMQKTPHKLFYSLDPVSFEILLATLIGDFFFKKKIIESKFLEREDSALGL